MRQIPQQHRDFMDGLIRDNNIPEPKIPGPWGTQRLQGLADTRRKLEIMMEEQIPIFASGLGSPAFILDEMHDAGVKVWGLVGVGRQAQREFRPVPHDRRGRPHVHALGASDKC